MFLHPSTRMVMPMPMMNIRPPMVGVPCLVMCHEGPISLMACPAFSRRSAGISSLPTTAVMAKHTTAGSTISIIPITACSFPPPGRRSFLYFRISL